VKLLLDSCVWGLALPELEEAGHDVVWAGSLDPDPGDNTILAIAYTEERILITLDKDFGELAIVQGKSHTGILRLVGFSARQQALASIRIIDRYSQDLAAGALITASPGRVRIRPV